MAIIDIPATLEELEAKKKTVLELIAGLENYLRLDLSDEEKENVRQLKETYEDWKDTLEKWITNATHSQELGYPNLPKMEVSPQMKETLEREKRETVAADNLFFVAPLAVTANVSFSEPQDVE